MTAQGISTRKGCEEGIGGVRNALPIPLARTSPRQDP